jgi:hypothetical protein
MFARYGYMFAKAVGKHFRKQLTFPTVVKEMTFKETSRTRR